MRLTTRHGSCQEDTLDKGRPDLGGILTEPEEKSGVWCWQQSSCWAYLSFTLVCLEADNPKGICQVDLYKH